MRGKSGKQDGVLEKGESTGSQSNDARRDKDGTEDEEDDDLPGYRSNIVIFDRADEEPLPGVFQVERKDEAVVRGDAEKIPEPLLCTFRKARQEQEGKGCEEEGVDEVRYGLGWDTDYEVFHFGVRFEYLEL